MRHYDQLPYPRFLPVAGDHKTLAAARPVWSGPSKLDKHCKAVCRVYIAYNLEGL